MALVKLAEDAVSTKKVFSLFVWYFSLVSGLFSPAVI